jgi:8-oxo-dGTP pyrophosphatase MutT (NUDIX family)
MNGELATYQVGLKLLLEKEGMVLLLRDRQTGHLDLPGGRINADEYEISITEALDREVREELGNDIQYTLDKPLFQFRRFNVEKSSRVFITVYGGEYISGDILLSDEHSAFEWIYPAKKLFTFEDFGNQEETSAMVSYFQNIV